MLPVRVAVVPSENQVVLSLWVAVLPSEYQVVFPVTVAVVPSENHIVSCLSRRSPVREPVV